MKLCKDNWGQRLSFHFSFLLLLWVAVVHVCYSLYKQSHLMMVGLIRIQAETYQQTMFSTSAQHASAEAANRPQRITNSDLLAYWVMEERRIKASSDWIDISFIFYKEAMQKTICETSRGSLSHIPFDERLMVFQPPPPPLCCSGAWSPNSMYRLCDRNCHWSYTSGNDSDVLGLVFSDSKWDDQRSPSVIPLFSFWSFVGMSDKAAFSNQIEKTLELN